MIYRNRIENKGVVEIQNQHILLRKTEEKYKYSFGFN